jgi:hypothetical protein
VSSAGTKGSISTHAKNLFLSSRKMTGRPPSMDPANREILQMRLQEREASGYAVPSSRESANRCSSGGVGCNCDIDAGNIPGSDAKSTGETKRVVWRSGVVEWRYSGGGDDGM